MRCHECLALLPYTHYDSDGEPFCNNCRRMRAEKELSEYKIQQLTTFQKTLDGELLTGPRRLEHVAECLAELVQDFGGIHGFTHTWYRQIQTAIDEKPGSRLVLDHLRSIAKLWVECSKLQHHEAIDEMNDQQLRSLKEMAMREFLVDAGSRQLMAELIKATDAQVGIEGPVELVAESA